MQHLGGADAIEHRLARLRHPCVVDRRWERLARRDRSAQRRQVGPFVHRGQHRPVRRRRGEAHRGLVRLDDLDQVGWRRVLEQGGGRPEPQREHRQPAEPERERQWRRADEHVVGRHGQHLLRVAVGDDQQIAMEVHRRLRLARRARGEAEQRNVVAAGGAPPRSARACCSATRSSSASWLAVPSNPITFVRKRLSLAQATSSSISRVSHSANAISALSTICASSPARSIGIVFTTTAPAFVAASQHATIAGLLAERISTRLPGLHAVVLGQRMRQAGWSSRTAPCRCAAGRCRSAPCGRRSPARPVGRSARPRR